MKANTLFGVSSGGGPMSGTSTKHQRGAMTAPAITSLVQ